MVQTKKFFIASFIFHFSILAVIVLGFDILRPLPVIENTNKHDSISAVILGDTPKSKILPTKEVPPETKKPEPVKKTVLPAAKPTSIAIPSEKAKPVKPVEKPHEALAKELLNEVKKVKLKEAELKKQRERKMREQAEKSLRQKLLEEEIKLQAQQEKETQGIVNKYQALIIQAISDHWIIPPGANKKLYSELLIHLGTGGTVLDVQVTKSSGDVALDHSARAAVFKSSPLPVPKEPKAFDAFRNFMLKVKPEYVLASH